MYILIFPFFLLFYNNSLHVSVACVADANYRWLLRVNFRLQRRPTCSDFLKIS